MIDQKPADHIERPATDLKEFLPRREGILASQLHACVRTDAQMRQTDWDREYVENFAVGQNIAL